MAIPNEGVPNFIERAFMSLRTASSRLRLDETRSKRVLRKFSLREVCEFLNVDRNFLSTWIEHPDGPEGEIQGRERTLTVEEILKVRAISGNRKKKRKDTLFWRKPGDPLPVLVVSSQKGGSGKTLLSCNMAQFAALFYGLRVGLIDADPQGTASLYFADSDTPAAQVDAETFTNFMGVGAAGTPGVVHSAERLNNMWIKTPWPGIRLLPGGPSIQEAEIGMHFLARDDDPRFRKVYRLLRDAIERWSEAHPPKTTAADLVDAQGRLKEDRFQSALTETLDLIIIDCAPSLSLPVLNAIVATDMLVVPSVMKGFDLSATSVYLSGANDAMDYIRYADENLEFRPLPSYIVPTIVSQQSDTDMRMTSELYVHDPEIVCPVFYARSEAVANASEVYQSVYEYQPPKSRKKSTSDFIENANAVNDALLTRLIPELPARGFANAFIAKTYGGAVPPWNVES